MFVVVYGYIDVVLLLFEKEVNVDIVDILGCIVLYRGIMIGYEECV